MSENLKQLQALAMDPAAVAWFRGLFEEVQVELTDTNEQFTIVHHGDQVDVLVGFQRPDANLIIPVQSQNLANLAAVFADGEVGPEEQYRIVKFMLRPCLKAALGMPILNNDMLLKVVRVDTIWQQALLDPEGNEDEQITVRHEPGGWTIHSGYQAGAKRRLRLTAAQMLDFQRRLFKADKANSMSAWLDLAKWYIGFRDEATVPVG